MHSLSQLQGFVYTLAMARQYGGFGETQSTAPREPTRREDRPRSFQPRPVQPKSTWMDEFRAGTNSGA